MSSPDGQAELVWGIMMLRDRQSSRRSTRGHEWGEGICQSSPPPHPNQSHNQTQPQHRFSTIFIKQKAFPPPQKKIK